MDKNHQDIVNLLRGFMVEIWVCVIVKKNNRITEIF